MGRSLEMLVNPYGSANGLPTKNTNVCHADFSRRRHGVQPQLGCNRQMFLLGAFNLDRRDADAIASLENLIGGDRLSVHSD